MDSNQIKAIWREAKEVFREKLAVFATETNFPATFMAHVVKVMPSYDAAQFRILLPDSTWSGWYGVSYLHKMIVQQIGGKYAEPVEAKPENIPTESEQAYVLLQELRNDFADTVVFHDRRVKAESLFELTTKTHCQVGKGMLQLRLLGPDRLKWGRWFPITHARYRLQNVLLNRARKKSQQDTRYLPKARANGIGSSILLSLGAWSRYWHANWRECHFPLDEIRGLPEIICIVQFSMYNPDANSMRKRAWSHKHLTRLLDSSLFAFNVRVREQDKTIRVEYAGALKGFERNVRTTWVPYTKLQEEIFKLICTAQKNNWRAEEIQAFYGLGKTSNVADSNINSTSKSEPEPLYPEKKHIIGGEYV